MARTDRLSTYKTKITEENGQTTVRYHQTNVVTFDADTITLRTGGWRSVTTLRKMNQAARQFGLNFSVVQRKGEWFVTYRGITEPFDGLYFVLERGEMAERHYALEHGEVQA